jgi:hypothetical protein
MARARRRTRAPGRRGFAADPLLSYRLGIHALEIPQKALKLSERKARSSVQRTACHPPRLVAVVPEI